MIWMYLSVICLMDFWVILAWVGKVGLTLAVPVEVRLFTFIESVLMLSIPVSLFP